MPSTSKGKGKLFDRIRHPSSFSSAPILRSPDLPPQSVPDPGTDVARGSRTEMSDATFTLWYYIGGERSFSFVDVSPNELIAHLREKIYDKNTNALQRVDASNLTLWKVR